MSRPCGPRPNKVNNAYSKDELVKMMVELDMYPRDEAERMSIPMLCKELNIDYTNPDEIQMTKYGECLKLKSKKSLLEEHKEILQEKGYSPEKAIFLKKERLCDLIYEKDDMFILPEDFDESNCSLYDMTTLTRIAVRRHIDTTRYTTQKDLCRAIQISYLREKMKFDTDKNPEWNNTETDETLSCMIPPSRNKELREHQKNLVKHMLRHRSLLAVHATGTGKTLSAIAAINCVMAKYPNIRVIIITPLSLVENMQKEIRRFGIDILNDENLYSRIEIYSYDEYVNLQKRKNEIDCKNTFLIIDEAHNLRTETLIKETALEKGSKSYIIMRCAASAFKVLLLTATPLINNIFDLRNLLMMLNGEDPEKALSRKQFIKETTESLGSMVNCKISYYDPPLDENYPSRIDKTIDMYMEPEYFKKYQDLENTFMEKATVGTSIKTKINDFFYHTLRIAINSLDGETSPKVNWIVDFIVNEAKEGRKSVVYSNWKKAGMNLLRKRLDELNQPGLYIYISGDVTREVRKIVRKKFNKDEAKILLISRAGGEGLDLKGVRNVIIMESNWNASADAQVIGRGIRYKSHLHLPEDQRNVTVYRILLHKPQGNHEFESVDDMLYKRAYEQKLPEIKGYLEIIKKNSIENQSCTCDISKVGNHEGCQSIEVPVLIKKTKTPSPEQQEVETLIQKAIEDNKPQEEIDILNKRLEDIKKVKKEVYEAPKGLTSIAITVSDVSKRLFRKIAGIGVATLKPEISTEEIDDIVLGGLDEVNEYEDLKDEYTDELQNIPDVPQEEVKNDIESIKDIIYDYLRGKDLNTVSIKDVRRHVKGITGIKPDKSIIKEIMSTYDGEPKEELFEAEEVNNEIDVEGLDDEF